MRVGRELVTSWWVDVDFSTTDIIHIHSHSYTQLEKLELGKTYTLPSWVSTVMPPPRALAATRKCHTRSPEGAQSAPAITDSTHDESSGRDLTKNIPSAYGRKNPRAEPSRPARSSPACDRRCSASTREMGPWNHSKRLIALPTTAPADRVRMDGDKSHECSRSTARAARCECGDGGPLAL